jgi:hypothetical protein
MSDMRCARARPGRAGLALAALAIAWTVLPVQAQHTHHRHRAPVRFPACDSARGVLSGRERRAGRA